MTTKEVQGDRSAEPPTRVFLLDDEEDWTHATAEFLDNLSPGIEVDIAHTVEEADDLLSKNDYAAYLVDVDLGPRSTLPGDAWMISRRATLERGVLCATVTARVNRIRDREQIGKFARIVEKSRPEEKALLREVAKLRGLVQHAKAFRPSDEIGDSPDTLGTAIRELFVAWLTTLSDRDRKDVVVGGRYLSFNDLISEVQRDTALGRRWVEMFVRHLELKLGLAKTSPFKR